MQNVTRNSKTLASFVAYCQANPYLRFWQALLNWSGQPYIFISTLPRYEYKPSGGCLQDPYHWEGRDS